MIYAFFTVRDPDDDLYTAPFCPFGALMFCGSVRVHAARCERTGVAKFWLDPIALQQAGGYGRPELNTIAAMVAEHRETLLEDWYEFFGR